MAFEEKNYLEEARSRVTEAFKSKPVFDRYLQLLTLPSTEVQSVLLDLYSKRWIDTAVGDQLDIIGRIVGQDRILVNADLYTFFGFEDHPQADSYGSVFNPSVGGYYRSYNSQTGGNIVLEDETYRLFIRAKIMKNRTRSTPEDVIAFLTFVFNVEKVWIRESAYGKARIALLGADMTDFEKNLLTLMNDSEFRPSYFVPKTLGVEYRFDVTTYSEYFSFLGASNAGTYGDENNPSVGGVWLSL